MTYRAEWSGTAVGSNRRLAKVTRSGVYQNFKQELAWCFRSTRKQTFEGPVDVRMRFRIWKQRDIDSLIKPTLDGLEAAGVYANDRQVRSLVAYREDKRRGEPDGIYVEVRDDKD